MQQTTLIKDQALCCHLPPWQQGIQFFLYRSWHQTHHLITKLPMENGFIERQIQTEEAHGKGHQHRKEFSRGPDQFESTATGRWFALTSIDTSWEEPCDKKGKPSRFSCCSSVFNCIAGQVHQEPWQDQVSKTPVSTDDWWGSLFPFREEWMANWHSYWYNRHWEKLQCPDTQGYITEKEQVTITILIATPMHPPKVK